jgi:hypothetical protein
MLVRSKQRERGVWGRRRGRGGHTAERLGGAPTVARQADAPARERRHGGPSQDRALYTCECGFVFEALVTTSVGCPHCARTQAW